MRCPECNKKTHKETEALVLKTNPDVIVKKVKVDICKSCGFSSISEDEYERVRKEIGKVKAPDKATVIL